MSFNSKFIRTTAALSTGLLAFGALTACANQQETAESHDHSHATAATHDHKHSLHTHEMWVKAADQGAHTAIFGNLHSDLKDKDLVIEKVTTDVAEAAEIHEVVNGKMQPVAGGLTLGAGQELDLEPGGHHLMLLNLKQQLRAGDTVKFTLHLKGGEEIALEAVVRDYSGANEEYDHSGHGDHDSHGSHDGHGDSESGHDH